MIKGTTPTIMYRFKVVQVSDIQIIYLSIRQGTVYIEKDIEDATLDTENNTVSWKLSQEDTLKLAPNNSVELQVRYKLSDTTAGASLTQLIPVDKILKGGEI